MAGQDQPGAGGAAQPRRRLSGRPGAVARALQLDDAERTHLLNLAQAADGSDALTHPRRRRAKEQWKPHRSLQWTLDAITAGPALVRNGRMDIVATNRLGRALYRDIYAAPGNQANLGRFQFLDPASRRDLVGELSTRSEEFRTRWGAHNVRHHGRGTKRFRHEVVGELALAFEARSWPPTPA